MESELPSASVEFRVLVNASIVRWSNGCAVALRGLVVPMLHVAGWRDPVCVGGVIS